MSPLGEAGGGTILSERAGQKKEKKPQRKRPENLTGGGGGPSLDWGTKRWVLEEKRRGCQRNEKPKKPPRWRGKAVLCEDYEVLATSNFCETREGIKRDRIHQKTPKRAMP